MINSEIHIFKPVLINLVTLVNIYTENLTNEL